VSSKKAIVTTNLPDLPAPEGARSATCTTWAKALIVATDRISAFDAILSPGFRGRASPHAALELWFAMLAEPIGVKHHLLQTNAAKFGGAREAPQDPSGRSVLAASAR
jgi:phosphoribosylaminoimidazole-succinocarboxamide synthase